MDAVRRARGPHAYVVLLGLKPSDPKTLHDSIQKGLPFPAFERLMLLMALPQDTGARILSIPPRTLHRRKTAGRLDPDESDRVVRLSRLFGHALELFEGDETAARQWLETPAIALAGESPLNMSRTEPGSLEVERLIGRLEHGVFG
jgi:putative toxin-antitoxin system antitoxin component (TIGR02293 family)